MVNAKIMRGCSGVGANRPKIESRIVGVEIALLVHKKSELCILLRSCFSMLTETASILEDSWSSPVWQTPTRCFQFF